jgi:hypothetical protein
MDFEKVEKFVRDHWPAALMTAILVIPLTATVTTFIFKDHLTFLDVRIKELERKHSESQEKAIHAETRATRLEEAMAKLTEETLKLRIADQVKPVAADFDRLSKLASLYTPSESVKRK